ncbi:hypothetical protein [Aquitalea aquatilis]|uniref:hypothetical protein n=1 Tax=Aquitalea aquatilis TaxID=1537400 RepID=UPI0010BDD236|nr:hypothetical protein [Aquitalea aquatilis]
MNLYNKGVDDAHAGKQPNPELRDQPYYMHGWENGRRDFERYRAYCEEGYTRYQAAVMSGMRDPDEACHD